MNVGSLFSGIGGLDLGLERAGMHVKWQCEIDPYCRAVLTHHWPGIKCYEDIRDIDGNAERVDLICGGFPCQPVSLAGKGLAQEDPRWLWPEFARVVSDLRPRYVLVENVPGLVRRGLDLVVTGLAEMGYDAEWEIVSAAACGAPHLRERLLIVACIRPDAPRSEWRKAQLHGMGASTGRAPEPGELRGPLPEAEHVADTDGAARFGPWPAGEAVFRPEAFERFGRCGRGDGDVQDPDSSALWVGGRTSQASSRWWWAVEPNVGRVAHGVPNRLAQLRALGNAVVPQVAEAVGRMILETAA